MNYSQIIKNTYTYYLLTNSKNLFNLNSKIYTL